MPKTSAGILLYRRRSGTTEVLLGHMGGPLWAKKDSAGWSIPKGEYDESEPAFAAAKREFEEELGHPVPETELVELGDVKQKSGKVVTVWAGEGDFDPGSITPGTFTMKWAGRMQEFPEIDRCGWFDLGTAREKLVAGQVPFLDRLDQLLRDR